MYLLYIYIYICICWFFFRIVCLYSCFSAGNFQHVYAHIHTQHCGHNCKIREMNSVTQRVLLSWGEPASLLWSPWAASPVQTVSGASVVTAAKTVIAWRCHNTGTCRKKQWLQQDFGLYSQSWRLFWCRRMFLDHWWEDLCAGLLPAPGCRWTVPPSGSLGH